MSTQVLDTREQKVQELMAGAVASCMCGIWCCGRFYDRILMPRGSTGGCSESREKSGVCSGRQNRRKTADTFTAPEQIPRRCAVGQIHPRCRDRRWLLRDRIASRAFSEGFAAETTRSITHSQKIGQRGRAQCATSIRNEVARKVVCCLDLIQPQLVQLC
jgi:hypothetical protein